MHIKNIPQVQQNKCEPFDIWKNRNILSYLDISEKYSFGSKFQNKNKKNHLIEEKIIRYTYFALQSPVAVLTFEEKKLILLN